MRRNRPRRREVTIRKLTLRLSQHALPVYTSHEDSNTVDASWIAFLYNPFCLHAQHRVSDAVSIDMQRCATHVAPAVTSLKRLRPKTPQRFASGGAPCPCSSPFAACFEPCKHTTSICPVVQVVALPWSEAVLGILPQTRSSARARWCTRRSGTTGRGCTGRCPGSRPAAT